MVGLTRAEIPVEVKRLLGETRRKIFSVGINYADTVCLICALILYTEVRHMLNNIKFRGLNRFQVFLKIIDTLPNSFTNWGITKA